MHERIDLIIDAARMGPAADVCTDSEFVRRIHLDLVGVIPTADEARQFIDDPSADKRARLIDRLLLDERFAHHMRIVFDAMMMERRAEKHIKMAPWRAYLVTSFRENRPLHELAREILWASPDGDGPEAAARFYLDREVQPHLVTRDIGRMMLGRDLQCAQCHDHPVIDDYTQAEYYGIYAFVNRSYLFTDKQKKQALLAEKAEGDVSYESVFEMGTKYHTGPQLPGQAEVDEPKLAKEELYKVKPPKDGRGVPAFSRRRQLAERLTDGHYAPFNRNMANRLWAVMFGRGIVHPLDLHHDDNPPVHPKLLTLLANELTAMNFNVRTMLREIALSATYQRSCRLPDDLAMSKAAAEKMLATAKMQHDRNLATWQAAGDESRNVAAKIDSIEKALAVARKASEQAAASLEAADRQLAQTAKTLESAQQDLDGKTTAARQAAEKRTAAQQAVDEKSNVKKSATEASKLDEAAKAAEAALAKSAAALKQHQAAHAQATQNQLAARKVLSSARAALASAEKDAKGSDALRQQLRNARDKVESTQTAAQLTGAAIVDAEALLAVASATKESEAIAASDKLLARSSERFFVCGLRPLSPEQMAMSLYQATGDLPARVDAARKAEAAKATKQIKEKNGKEAAESKGGGDQSAPIPISPEAFESLAYQAVYDGLQGVMDELVGVFAQTEGQPTRDYEGRSTEALYLANSARVKGLIGGPLARQLAAIEKPEALADELYLAILSRRPVPEETAIVTDFLDVEKENRQLAISEMIWGLVSSVEFRFNH